LGRVTCDIVFGGVYYLLIDPKPLGLSINRDNARALVDAGSAIHQAVARDHTPHHPEMPGLAGISYAMFIDETEDSELLGATILPPGRIDRSPCGTGNAARLALRAARGDAKVGETRVARSIIGSRFEVTYAGDTTVAGRPAILTEIAGRGWVHGIHQIGVDPTDPWPEGFWLSDTWGTATDLLR
jgi:proline racemase